MRFSRRDSGLALAVGLVCLLGCKPRSDASSVKIANAQSAAAIVQDAPNEYKAAYATAVAATVLLGVPDGICTGTIVSAHQILTAAHCFGGHDGRTPRIGTSAQVQVRGRILEGRLKDYTRDFRPATGGVAAEGDYSDAAVIAVDDDLTFGGMIEPLKIASPALRIAKMVRGAAGSPAAFKEIGLVLGYGGTRFDGSGNEAMILHAKEIEFVGDDPAESDLKTLVVYLRGAMSASDRRPGTVCPGDSGGPTVIIQGGEPILIGINSRGRDCQQTPWYRTSDVRTAGPGANFMATTLGNRATFSRGTPANPLASPNAQAPDSSAALVQGTYVVSQRKDEDVCDQDVDLIVGGQNKVIVGFCGNLPSSGSSAVTTFVCNGVGRCIDQATPGHVLRVTGAEGFEELLDNVRYATYKLKRAAGASVSLSPGRYAVSQRKDEDVCEHDVDVSVGADGLITAGFCGNAVDSGSSAVQKFKCDASGRCANQLNASHVLRILSSGSFEELLDDVRYATCTLRR